MGVSAAAAAARRPGAGVSVHAPPPAGVPRLGCTAAATAVAIGGAAGAAAAAAAAAMSVRLTSAYASIGQPAGDLVFIDKLVNKKYFFFLFSWIWLHCCVHGGQRWQGAL